ncbi:MAG TPA: hypothetical protein VNR87_06915 [Flavisolibacter sp.]|nr:hypothetical protein [Flavisolibacter sp.]
MSLSEDLLKKLKGKFQPSTIVQFRYRTNDIAVETDHEGNAMRLFIGKLKDDGMIRGDRYSRVIVKDREGAVIKDHWDRKGKAS